MSRVDTLVDLGFDGVFLDVVDAYEYASKHYVMLEELQIKVGERIATLVKADAALVTSGAASALKTRAGGSDAPGSV